MKLLLLLLFHIYNQLVHENKNGFTSKLLFQNVHLVQKWLSTLEKKLETYSEESHQDYRVFISAEPAASAEYHIIPQGILESAIKITNEPPTGMFANLHKALDIVIAKQSLKLKQ